MALTHATALRNAIADAVDNYLNTTGSTDATADLELLDAAVSLVVINLQNPAFGAAASGVITLAGVPLSNTAGASGTVDNFAIRDRDNADAITGTVTGTGGGGDIEVTNTSITSGQTVQITSLTYTAPT